MTADMITFDIARGERHFAQILELQAVNHFRNVDYDAQSRESVRVVEPAGLFGTQKGWYLAAWCRLRQAPRAFRLDRIAHVTITDEQVTPRSIDAILTDVPHELTGPALW